MSNNPPPNEKQALLMPDEDNELNNPDPIVAAVVEHLHDDVEDARVLRGWRRWIAVILIAVVLSFYVFILLTISVVATNPYEYYWILQAQTLCGIVIVVLAAIPTLIVVGVMKAIFGSRKATDSPYSPIHALFQLLKDVNGSN